MTDPMPTPVSEPTDLPAPQPEQLPSLDDTPPVADPPVNPDTSTPSVPEPLPIG